ncbi:MAG: amidohydrolase [DPANN group archaeon]|nr:amidohydrolase [DPANN group archaeon]
MEILLKDCSYILTQDQKRSIIKNEDILIQDSKIVKIGKDLQTSGKVLDCKDKFIIPGLINTHNHLAMTLFKGYSDDMSLDKWLSEKIWPVEDKLDEKSAYYGVMLAFIEMIRTGTTCFNDMYMFSEGVCDAAIEVGIRGFISRGSTDIGETEKSEEKLKERDSFISYLLSKKSNLLRSMVGPHAPYTCSKDHLMGSRKLAEKYNIPLHIHVSETVKEVEDSIKQYGLTPIEYLESIGFLKNDVIMAHSCHLSENDFKILSKNGVKISHNPSSNMKLATGSAMPLSKLLKAKILVGLGTDGSASNNSLDMFSEMKVCALLHKFVENDPEVISAQQVFDLATVCGAKVLGIEDLVGSIEIGKQADLVICNLNDIAMFPNHNLVSNIVYSANGSCVDTTIVSGKILMENKVLKTIDEGAVFKGAKEFLSHL